MPANEGVEVKQSQILAAGQGLFARTTFSPGDTVAAVDRPLVTELETDRMLDTCAWCCHRGATNAVEKAMAASIGLPQSFIEIKSCTGCHRVAYCSRACQSRAWKREHRYECKVIKNAEEVPDLPPGVRGAIKILGRLKAEPDNEYARVRNILKFWPVGDPNGLKEISTQNKKKLEDLQFLGSAAWLYMGKPNIDTLDPKSISIGLVSNIMSNAIALSAGLDGVALGIGFDPLMSSANHSCDPNASLVFNQPGHEIRALRNIKVGEEVFISYIEATNPFSVRQAELKENYFFTCRCTKCKKGVHLEADKFLEQPENLKSEYHKLADKLVSRHESKLSRFLVPGNHSEAQNRVAAIEAEAYSVLENERASSDEIKETIRMCIGSKMWHWARQPIPQLCHRLGTLYLESGSVYQAFRVGVKLHLEILPIMYPQEFYQARLIGAWTVSTLINVLCGTAHEELYKELAQGGIELRVLYFGFLFYLREHTPRMFGSNTPFGKLIETTYGQIMAGVSIPETEIKEKIQVAWPSLEALAHNFTVSSL
ncbi:hypothetical protein ANO14919_112450 [Xylariales sp. No.14919]|nr:hypothetical protein F5X98DRAFT_357844 [Xylaria grammica]GAW21721.1 hypothetical protein ANO14919_112450 [Xylariales sp. No.14919]